MTGILRSVNSVRIFTRDLERARRFYGDVLELEEQAAGGGFVVFDLSGVDIILEFIAADDEEGEDLVGRLLTASFRVDDVEAAYQYLQDRGVSFLQPPERQPWGGTLAFARDPDDNVITLVG
jgi:catechol 2,3-dioxygenase-like lactoylglutathione lyase family enzyme